MMLLRHLLAVLLLPLVVLAVVPGWLLRSPHVTAIDSRWDGVSLMAWAPRLAGIALFLAGFALFAWCISLFARVGRGTLAPWDPTQRLVAVGPYRYVRNPMISGVVAMLFGEALISGSWAIAVWAGAFLLINHTYFLLAEEPGLERRFGESYRAFKSNVPRWIPRRTPWAGGA
jgi:protein-S-isoprenylcysteine O-methyltransferase Ste14